MKKEVPNNYRENPIKWYMEKLSGMDAEEISNRCSLERDGDTLYFTILGSSYKVQIPSFEFTLLSADKPDIMQDQAAQILILSFLTESSYAAPAGRFVSFREYPSGELYYKAFEGRCLKRLAFSYGTKLDAFRADCLAIGAKEISGGDAAYEIVFMPGLTIRIILWGPDEEFPPAAQILFSDNFPFSFSAEGVAGIGDIVISALKRIRKS